jgi:flagellar hook-associated protein 3 FlgL
MRISTAHAYDAAIDQLSQRQNQLAEAQLRLTSGKRVTRASDDPVNAARAERALADVTRATTGQRSLDASRSAMTQLESALGDASNLLQTAREAIVSGGDATYSDSQRQVLASQIRDLRNQLLSVANRGDGAGGYLFGGQGSNAQPFIDAAGGVQYIGTPGANSADPAAAMPMTMDGAQAWMTAPTGNGVFETKSVTSTGSAWIDGGTVTNPGAITGSSYQLQFSVAAGATTYSVLKDGAPTAMTNVPYVSGQAIQIDGMAVTVSGQPATGDEFAISPSQPTLSVFDALDKAANDLTKPRSAGSAVAQGTSDDLRNLDSVLARMSGSRSTAGEALNRIDGISNQLDSESLNGQTRRSAAEDLDMPSAISDFQNQQTGYQAALKTYAAVQHMSLFDYIQI